MAKKINEMSGMPQMRSAFSGWQVSFVLIRITQTNNEGDITDVETSLNYVGTVQPLSPEEIKLKPEGQRSWQWLQVHVIIGEDLKTNDRVFYNGKRYKVMLVKDYRLNNYIEYHLLEDYKDA